MIQCKKEYAIQKAIELTVANISSTPTWVQPENVTKFMNMVYDCLVSEEKEA